MYPYERGADLIRRRAIELERNATRCAGDRGPAPRPLLILYFGQLLLLALIGIWQLVTR